jgi:signal transduction histidine kinase
MAEEGFAIRCPHCLEWQVWGKSPEEFALKSEAELREIVEGLRTKGKAYTHPNLLRCDQPLSICPAPTEVVVCKSESDSLRFVQKVEAWSLKREFRLYASNCRDRREDFFGILFSVLPVERQRHILLEDLMDRELLSHSLVGMGLKIQAPFTVFAANVFESDEEVGKPAEATPSEGNRRRELVYWPPIEAEEPTAVPPRFCGFCRVCRETVMNALIKKFKACSPSPDNCPHRPKGLGRGQTCAGKKAACQEKDWNHCPAFLQLRAKECPCYQSDLGMIKAFEKAWLAGGPVELGKHEERKCWAGLTEVGLPIIVHDHLVGVAMTGQFVLEPSDLPKVKDLLAERPLLKPAQGELERFREILLGAKPDPRKEEEVYTRRFRLTAGELEEKIKTLRQGVEQIVEVAETHYQRIRGRSESVFKQELLGRIENRAGEPGFFRRPMLDILERMREFWAIRAAYMLVLPKGSRDLSVLALCTPNRKDSFGFPGRRMGQVPTGYYTDRPLPMLLDYADESRMSRTPAKDFKPFLDDVMLNPEWDVPRDARCYFAPLAPVADQLFAFLFAERDQSAVSPLGRPVPRGLSELAQDAIFETCTDVVHRLGDVWYHGIREQAWREFSAQASHRIGNEVHAFGTLLDVLSRELQKSTEWKDRWGKRLAMMKDSVNAAKEMLTEQTQLTAYVKPRREKIRVRRLIEDSVQPILPPTATLTVEGSAQDEDVSLDPRLMTQVFRELAINAIRMAGPGVRLAVVIDKEAPPPKGTQTTPASEYLRVAFCDDGPGFSSEQAERAFSSPANLVPGRTGLGLITARRIIEAHGGTVALGPAGKGACILIRLPTIPEVANGG